MAELIGAVSAIASLVDFSGKILVFGYGFIAKVARAPTEVRTMLTEVASLNVVLAQMQALVADEKDEERVQTTLQTLALFGCVSICRDLLQSIESSIKACEHENGHNIKNFGKRLLWPMKERETKDMLQRLTSVREKLSAALAIDSAAALQRIEKTGDLMFADMKIANRHIEEAKAQSLKKWLCPEQTNPEECLESALQLHYKDTGQWFLESKRFTQWVETNTEFIWIHGIPGCGKTILSAAIIENLLYKSSFPDGAVTYFFCDHANPRRRSLRSFLMTVASQLLRAHSNCLNISSAFFKSKNEDLNGTITTTDYINLLRTMSLNFHKVFVVIDALDESFEQDVFVRGLQLLLNDTGSGSRFQMIVTSRSEKQLERLLSPLATSQVCLPHAVGEDIQAYVRGETLQRLSSKQLKLRDSALADQIVDTLISQADGVFLQAKLQLDYICTMTTDGAIKNALKHLPHGLDQTYDRVLEQIMSTHSAHLDLIKTIL